MEVMISVCGETPTIGEVFHCGDAYATVVSVDTSGNPVELPFELAPDSPADKLRCADAADRSGPTHALLNAEVTHKYCQPYCLQCALYECRCISEANSPRSNVLDLLRNRPWGKRIALMCCSPTGFTGSLLASFIC